MLCSQSDRWQTVLDALRANGVEVLEEGLRLVPKKRVR
jgi:hypothetical protein